jgi:prepilin signal peptidase PulO-like enzyme (type II secretory pathway)
MELILLFVVGLAVGSFLTLVVDRFETAESIWVGRSHCNKCKEQLRWWELVPFISFVALRGKCVRCNTVIPRVYPFFELLTGVAFALVWFKSESYLVGVLNLLVVSSLLLLVFYDWLHQEFPTVFLIGCGVLVVVSMIVRSTNGAIVSLPTIPEPLFAWLNEPAEVWQRMVVGGLVGAGFLGLFAIPSRGQWMGYGDVVLGGILGAWLGYPLIVIALLLAFYMGAIVGGGMWLLRQLSDNHRIAFGPFLILGAFITYIWSAPLFLAIMKIWNIEL